MKRDRDTSYMAARQHTRWLPFLYFVAGIASAWAQGRKFEPICGNDHHSHGAGPGREATGFQDPKRVAGSLWDRLGENIVLGGLDWRQMGVYSQPPEGQKVYSGLEDKRAEVMAEDQVNSG